MHFVLFLCNMNLFYFDKQVMKYMKHYVKSDDVRKKIAMGLDTGLGAMFGLAAVEVGNSSLAFRFTAPKVFPQCSPVKACYWVLLPIKEKNILKYI